MKYKNTINPCVKTGNGGKGDPQKHAVKDGKFSVCVVSLIGWEGSKGAW